MPNTNHRSSTSFHQASAGVTGPSSAAVTSPPCREGWAQYVLMYPKPSLTRAQGNLCHITNECGTSPWYPAPCSLLPTSASHGGTPFPRSLCSPKSAGALFLAPDKWTRVCAHWRHEGNSKRQHISCSFSLNGRDSYSWWHKLAYPTYMHLNAS